MSLQKILLVLLLSLSSQITFAQNNIVGMCLAYIQKEIQAKGGRNNIDPRYQRYMTKNQTSLDAFSGTYNKFPRCFDSGVIIENCLKSNNVNTKTIELVLGFNTGVTNYKDPAFRTNASLACMD
jgi:hypothetical protein